MLTTVANHLLPRRQKVFGDGPRIPLDREAKARIMHLARALKHKTEPGKHYGVLTGKFVDVLHAMLWLIHDGRTGQCNPSYGTIADKARCAASTVCEAIKTLETVGILSWVNRIVRIRIRERDLFGQWATTWRVLRTSNAYVFHDPRAAERSKTELRCGPPDKFKNNPLAASYPQAAMAAQSGARLDGARVIPEEFPRAPPERAESSAIALQREQAARSEAELS